MSGFLFLWLLLFPFWGFVSRNVSQKLAITRQLILCLDVEAAGSSAKCVSSWNLVGEQGRGRKRGPRWRKVLEKNVTHRKHFKNDMSS